MNYLNKNLVPLIKSITPSRKPSPIMELFSVSNKQYSNQSFVIKFGNIIEQFWNCTVTDFSDENYIEKTNKIKLNNGNKKQIDICFKGNDKKIYYRESKCNLDLDSEKKKVSNIKIFDIQKQLEQELNTDVDAGYFCPIPIKGKNNTSKTNYINKGITVNGPDWMFRVLNLPFTLDEYLTCMKEEGTKQYSLFF